MVTMRAQAVDMIYRLPDKEVVAVINFLKNILNKDKYDNDTIAGNEMDLAFERLEKWREDNKEFFEPDFDWKKEVKEARKEKVKKMRGCLSEYARTDDNEMKERLYMARSLHGIVPPDITLEEA